MGSVVQPILGRCTGRREWRVTSGCRRPDDAWSATKVRGLPFPTHTLPSDRLPLRYPQGTNITELSETIYHPAYVRFARPEYQHERQGHAADQVRTGRPQLASEVQLTDHGRVNPGRWSLPGGT